MKPFAAALMPVVALLSLGCDQAADQASRAVEQRVQEETNKLVDKALGSVDKALQSAGNIVAKDGKGITLVPDAGLKAAGLAATTVQVKAAPEPKASVYMTFERAGQHTLEVRYRNAAGEEIGRSRQKVQAREGDGLFVEFPIDPRTPVADIRSVAVKKV